MNNYLTSRQIWSIGIATVIIGFPVLFVWDKFYSHTTLESGNGSSILANSDKETIGDAGLTLVYQYDNNFNIVGVNGLIGIEELMADCDSRIAKVVVDKVEYKEGSDIITGFYAKKLASKKMDYFFSIDSDVVDRTLNKLSKLDVQKLIRKGEHLIVVYQVCGSGGFTSARDIFKWSALNNP